jgi:hypothetical protein
MRSLNTSFVAVLPVLSLLLVGTVLLGATALVEFALALLIGLIVGAYSSIFVSAPLFVVLKEREPRSRALREKAETYWASQGVVGAPVAAAAPAPMADVYSLTQLRRALRLGKIKAVGVLIRRGQLSPIWLPPLMGWSVLLALRRWLLDGWSAARAGAA